MAMAKFTTFKKGLLLGLTVATLATSSMVQAEDGDAGPAAYIGGVVGGLMSQSASGAGLGTFFYPSRTATDEEMRKLTEEYRKKQQQQSGSSSGSYRSCSGCAAK
jgi:hypothetical protein